MEQHRPSNKILRLLKDNENANVRTELNLTSRLWPSGIKMLVKLGRVAEAGKMIRAVDASPIRTTICQAEY